MACSPVRAQPPKPLDLNGLSAFDRALDDTASTGRISVVAITSSANPASRQLWWNLVNRPEIRELTRTMNFVEVLAEADPARVQRMGIKVTPTFLAYRRGPKGLELLGTFSGPKDDLAVATWLGVPTPAAAEPPAAMSDPAVMRTGHHGGPDAQPSAQGYYPPPQAPQAPPPQQFMAPPQPVMMAPVAPVYSAPPAPPVTVSAPPQTVHFQQQAPTIVVSPPAPPNVVYSAPAMAPVQPIQQPAPAAPVAAPAAPVMMAPAAPPVQQQSVIGTAVVGLVLENPSLIRQLLGALGRFLSRFGNPTVRMANIPQTAQVPLTTTLPAMAPAPAQPVYAIPQPPSAPHAPMPSPQGEPRKHGLFHRN